MNDMKKKLLDNTVELILKYKICQNNDLKHISYLCKLLKIKFLIFAAAAVSRVSVTR